MHLLECVFILERARRRLVLEAALEEIRIVALALMMFTCIRIRVF